MKRHKSISTILRNRDLSFWTPVNFEVEYFLNEETKGAIGTAGGRQASAPLAATMGTTAARPLSSGTRPRAVHNWWFYVNNSKNN